MRRASSSVLVRLLEEADRPAQGRLDGPVRCQAAPRLAEVTRRRHGTVRARRADDDVRVDVEEAQAEQPGAHPTHR
jgi:hypothetical protein